MGLKHLRWGWLAVPIIVFIPYFRSSILPFHDTLWKYEYFHFFYSHWVSFRELPLWEPYGSYGISAGYSQLALVSPSNYLFALIGAMFHVSNTLILFKLSFLLDFLIYSAGIYLFAREVYRNEWSIAFVFLTGVASFSWIVQSHLNFYIFYLLPLAIWALYKFSLTLDIRYIGFLILVEAISFIGNIPYFAPLHLFVLTVILVMLFNGKGISLRTVKLRRVVSLEFVSAFMLSVLLIVCAYSAVHDTLTLAAGRNLNNFRVPLHIFLNYGRMTPSTSFVGLVTGAIPNADNTYYVGILPLVLVCWGVFRLEKPIFIGLSTAAIALIWLSIGGWFARLIYLFPGMMLYRHIGLTFGVIGLLLILASGFVVDRLLDGKEEIPNKGKWHKAFKIIFLLLGIDLIISWHKDNLHVLEPISKYLLLLFALRVVLYGWVFYRHVKDKEQWLNPVARMALAAVFLFDILSFQLSVQSTIPRTVIPYPSVTFQADRLEFLPTRTNEINLKAAGADRLKILQEHANYPHNSAYAFIYNWLGADPCWPVYRNDLWQRSVVEAIAARGGNPRQWNDSDFLPRNDVAYSKSVGCGADKIQLVRSFSSAIGTQDTIILKSINDPSQTLVIRDPPEVNMSSSGIDAGTTKVEFFNANKIRVAANIENRTPEWLYYADAYDERWQASIDGEPAKIYRANVGFKAILVPPGEHDVVMEFTGGKFLNYGLAGAGIISILFLGGWMMLRLVKHPSFPQILD